jgi:hypothetical protein
VSYSSLWTNYWITWMHSHFQYRTERLQDLKIGGSFLTQRCIHAFSYKTLKTLISHKKLFLIIVCLKSYMILIKKWQNFINKHKSDYFSTTHSNIYIFWWIHKFDSSEIHGMKSFLSTSLDINILYIVS